MGLALALIAYVWWACTAIYWHLFPAADPLELVAHRTVWSLATLLPMLAFRGRLGTLWDSLRSPRSWVICGIDGWLVVLNWLVYVWAIHQNRILDTSLGYFLSPLVSIALAGIFEKERLSRIQLISVGLAVAGVVVLASRTGCPPITSLALAGTWGIYSLIKRRTPLGPVTSLSHEMVAVFPLALGGIVWAFMQDRSLLNDAPPSTWLWAVSTGLVTAVPLLLFAEASKRVPLSTLGLYQYLTPTLSALIAIFMYHEPFPPTKQLAFGLIGLGLVLHSAERIRSLRAQRKTPATTARTEEVPQ